MNTKVSLSTFNVPASLTNVGGHDEQTDRYQTARVCKDQRRFKNQFSSKRENNIEFLLPVAFVTTMFVTIPQLSFRQ